MSTEKQIYNNKWWCLILCLCFNLEYMVRVWIFQSSQRFPRDMNLPFLWMEVGSWFFYVHGSRIALNRFLNDVHTGACTYESLNIFLRTIDMLHFINLLKFSNFFTRWAFLKKWVRSIISQTHTFVHSRIILLMSVCLKIFYVNRSTSVDFILNSTLHGSSGVWAFGL